MTNQWSQGMEPLFFEKGRCFEKQYGRQQQLLLVSSYYMFVVIRALQTDRQTDT
jgi:hypothetical protein